MQASVVITTKNRKADLLQAIDSSLRQTASPEVLVLDDGSTDGTADLVNRLHPAVRCFAAAESQGYIVQRNRAARLASGQIIFSLDDDAIFSSPSIVETTLREFDDPRVGAVAIPFVDVHRSAKVRQFAPTPGVYANYDFIGTAHAVRRDLFLALGGYREVLVHQSEEEDYCIRMLNHGYIVRLGSSQAIVHFESPRRSWTRMDYFGARNKILYAWHNVPQPYLIGHLAMTTAKTLLYTLHPSRFAIRLKGVVNAYHAILSRATARQPVQPATYLMSRKLKRHGPIRIQHIEPELRRLSSACNSQPPVSTAQSAPTLVSSERPPPMQTF